MKTICYCVKSSDDKTELYVKQWVPDGKIKAILQITHGMLEYIDRYDDFATYLANNSILVTGLDLLGHGNSVTDISKRGFFSESKGNEIILEDIETVMGLTKYDYPNIPYFHLGHSMGSYLVRQLIAKTEEHIDGAIIVGTGLPPKILLTLGEALSKIISIAKGSDYRSKLIDDMSIGKFNKHYENPNTNVDWISRDNKVVNDYVKDPKINFKFTTNAYQNMYKSIKSIHNKGYVNRTRKDMPILFVSGANDPVGDMGEGVRRSYQMFKDLDFKDVSIKLYEGARHEIINEINKQEVYEDIYNWMIERVE